MTHACLKNDSVFKRNTFEYNFRTKTIAVYTYAYKLIHMCMIIIQE